VPETSARGAEQDRSLIVARIACAILRWTTRETMWSCLHACRLTASLSWPISARRSKR